MALWTFKAEYDAEAQVWWTSNDALGITTEGDTLEALAHKLETMVPEMIEENGAFLTELDQQAPHDIHLIAHHEMQLRAAYWSTATANAYGCCCASMDGNCSDTARAIMKSGTIPLLCGVSPWIGGRALGARR